MNRLAELIVKNFKILVRAKVSSLVIFIGPLLLVSLLGLAYSQSSTFTLTAAVYSPAYTELADSLVTKMENQNFRVVKQDSQDNCIGAVKRMESQACVIFPAGMSVEGGKTNEITFYVDYSQINLVWLMLDVMSTRVSERSDEISKDIASDVLGRMLFVEDKILAGKSTLSQVSTSASSIRNSSTSSKEGMQRLDIAVDFSGIDIDGMKASNLAIDSILANVSRQAAELVDETGSDIESIEGSASAIGSLVNSSDVNKELEDIDDAADRIADALSNASESTDDALMNASSGLTAMRSSLDSISAKLDAAKSKLDGLKQQRDELLPGMDKVSADIDSLIVNVNTLQSTLDSALERISAVKGKSAESIVSPITTKIEPISAQKTHFNSLFPALLVLIIMITGILLSSTLTIVEKKSKAFFRNSFTPTSYSLFSLSTYLTSLIVIFIQLMLFVSVSAFFFETEVMASVWLLLLLVFLTSTVFICIGMLVGFLFRTEETANLAAITLISLFLLFSTAVIPLESLPAYLKSIAMFNPFVVSELALRQTMIFQLGFAKVAYSICMLAAYSAIIFGTLIAAQDALKRLSFAHFKNDMDPAKVVKEKKAQANIANTAEEKRQTGVKKPKLAFIPPPHI